MQEVISTGPGDNRIEAYRLLSERAPVRVVVDTDMREGQWLIVRAPTEHETRRIRAQTAALFMWKREKSGCFWPTGGVRPSSMDLGDYAFAEEVEHMGKLMRVMWNRPSGAAEGYSVEQP